MTARSIASSVPPVAPRRRRGADRRTSILRAAAEVFLDHPFEQASIAEIAERAGCVEGTIYTYFGSKRELLDAVLADFYDRLIGDIELQLERLSGSRARLEFLVRRHLRIGAEEPRVAALIIRESRTQTVYFGSALHALNRRYSRFLLRALADAQACGEMRADLDPRLVRDMVFGGLEHVVWNALGRGQPLDVDARAAMLVSLLIDGLRPQAPVIAAPDGSAHALGALEARLARIERRLGAESGADAGSRLAAGRGGTRTSRRRQG